MRQKYTVYVGKFNPLTAGREWQPVTTCDSMYDALSARDNYQRANPGAQLMINSSDDAGKTWSVYRLEPSGAWRRYSTWQDQAKAYTACRVKRLTDPDGTWEVFATGEAPDPDADQADIEGARERRRQGEELARAILAERRADPNRCRAIKPGQAEIHALCIRIGSEHLDGHMSAYELALKTLRDRDEGVSGWPEGGRGVRGFQPVKGREGRRMFKVDRPPEDSKGDDAVTPAGDGYAPGRPIGRHRRIQENDERGMDA